MDSELQRLQGTRSDRHDAVREKLRRLLEFHDIVGFETHRVVSSQTHAAKVEASKSLMNCLRIIAKVAAGETQDAAEDKVLLGLEDKDKLTMGSAVDEGALGVSKHRKMKAQLDAKMITAFAMLVLAIYAIWC